MLPPQLHLVGGGEARRAEGCGVSWILLFHRDGVFKEGGSSLFLAFEVRGTASHKVPASTMLQAQLASCALSRAAQGLQQACECEWCEEPFTFSAVHTGQLQQCGSQQADATHGAGSPFTFSCVSACLKSGSQREHRLF